MKRALIVCPGRGSYDRAGLKQLQQRSGRAAEAIARCDAWRTAHNRPTVSELDQSDWSLGNHVAGENASLLTFACSVADFYDIDRDQFEVVGVVGNSMGWYTSLAVAGALPLDAAIRLVDTMGVYQENAVIGGQLLWPVTTPGLENSPLLRQRAVLALQKAKEQGVSAWLSIDLGAWWVLAGDEDGLGFLSRELGIEDRSGRTFPARLPRHSAFHTPLLEGTKALAREELADLPLVPPVVPLVDGNGRIWRPIHANPAEMWEYTLGAQLVDPYYFAVSVRTALRHTGADVIIALGPGNSLGANLARALTHEGWHRVRDQAAFKQRSAENPLLLSMGLPEQRNLVRRPE